MARPAPAPRHSPPVSVARARARIAVTTPATVALYDTPGQLLERLGLGAAYLEDAKRRFRGRTPEKRQVELEVRLELVDPSIEDPAAIIRASALLAVGEPAPVALTTAAYQVARARGWKGTM